MSQKLQIIILVGAWRKLIELLGVRNIYHKVLISKEGMVPESEDQNSVYSRVRTEVVSERVVLQVDTGTADFGLFPVVVQSPKENLPYLAE